VSVTPYPAVAEEEATKPLLSACLFSALVTRSYFKVVGNKFRRQCWSENGKENVTKLKQYFGVEVNFCLLQHFYVSRLDSGLRPRV
jgi:hypothetical protein